MGDKSVQNLEASGDGLVRVSVERNDSLPSQSTVQGARLRLIVTLLRMASALLVVILVVIILMLATMQDAFLLSFFGVGGATLLLGLPLAGFVLADRLQKTARRHLALSASEARLQDPRPPILYLR